MNLFLRNNLVMISARIKPNFNKEPFVIALFTFLFCISPIFGFERISTHIIIPSLFIYYVLIKRNKKLLLDRVIFYYTVFVVLSLVSFINSFNDNVFDYESYVNVSLKVVFSFLFIIIIHSSTYKNPRRIYTYFFVYIISVFIYFLYVYTIYKGQAILQVGDRLSQSNFDANMFGYFAIFSIFSSLFINIKYQNIWSKGIIVLTILISLILIISAATRGGFFMLILAFSLLFTSRIFIKNSSIISKIINIVLLLALGFLIKASFNKVLENTNLGNRILKFEDTRDDSRIGLAHEGIKLGLKSPIIGHGAGQFSSKNDLAPGLFSHNAYTEIFANYGMITLLFYFLFHFSIIKNIKMLFHSKNQQHIKIARISAVFLIVFIVYNIFYVMYLNWMLFSILFVVNAQLKWKLTEFTQIEKSRF